MLLCILQMVNAVLIRRPAAGSRSARAASRIFDGVKRDDWRKGPEAARKFGAILAGRGEIAYWVMAPEIELAQSNRSE